MAIFITTVIIFAISTGTLGDDHVENTTTKISFSEIMPPETEVEEQNGRWCHCWNNTDTDGQFMNEIECRCYGNTLYKIPRRLPFGMKKLTVTDAGIKILVKSSLQPHSKTLEDVTLNNLPKLSVIERGTFRNIDNLRSLYISHAPLLKRLPMLFEGVSSTKFLSLRILHTGLEEIPDLSPLNQNKILHMIDLEDNEFHILPSHAIKIQAEQVMLNYNQITRIESHAFAGSQIAKLSFKGNPKLSYLDEEAFSGLRSLVEFFHFEPRQGVHCRDLSGTSIEYLPVKGLDEMEILRIQNTKSLKVIPSVYNFKYLKEAWLTHSFHCCAFKYPAQHDPHEHALYTQRLKDMCKFLETHSLSISHPTTRRKRNLDASAWDKFQYSDDDWGQQFDQPLINETAHLSIRGEVIGSVEDSDNVEHEIYDGVFHPPVDSPGSSSSGVSCGNITEFNRQILCYPKPDALNPCEDIMGSNWLRISVWFVVVAAVIGNLAVIVVFFSSLFDINVPKFLMCHLACADICMGFYLLLIASMDLHSMGFYFNFAYDWQIGDGCRIAGFLTVFSSQLSVFTLTIITLERWFAIRYAIYLNRRIRLGCAAKIMVVGWMYSILMASLPLFGISNYSSTSICLPMEIQDPQDQAYLVALLMTNGFAFLVIVVCYTQIYFSLGQETRRSSSNSEMTIAKKMAMLVFTDFACWAPIAFFGLTALSGYPLIDVTRSKILLVFFYPLNSCANPYLYAILTAQYRRDFYMLLQRCGVCKKRVRKYTMNTTDQTSNPSNPIPLLVKNGRKLSKSTNVDEALV